MSKVSGILCTILRRFSESEHPKVAFAAACEKAGCECAGGGAFSVAHRVDQASLLKLVSELAVSVRQDEEQFLEQLGRSVAGILRTSYPTTFRTLVTTPAFAQTAVSIDYSILFPTVTEEAAAVIWNGRQQNREIVFAGLPDRRSAGYLRGFFEGAASVVNEPVAVRVSGGPAGGYQITVIAGRGSAGGDEKRTSR